MKRAVGGIQKGLSGHRRWGGGHRSLDHFETALPNGSRGKTIRNKKAYAAVNSINKMSGREKET